MSPNQKIRVYVGDKGYDSEYLHRLIRDTLLADSLIPVSIGKRKKINGYYRNEIAQSFDETLYHRRNLVENVFPVLKRRFGKALKARKFRFQIKEIKMKVIVDNIPQFISSFSFLITIDEVYRAEITKQIAHACITDHWKNGSIHDAIRIIMLSMETESKMTASVSKSYIYIQTVSRINLPEVIERDIRN